MCLRRTGSENMPKIITNNTINLFFKLQSAFCHFQTITFSECYLIKLLLYILLDKYINILALEMASPGNQQCSNCIGALSSVSAQYYCSHRAVLSVEWSYLLRIAARHRVRVFVCLSASISPELHVLSSTFFCIFCASCLWPWLAPLLAALAKAT